ncbi:c-type cytochrome [Reichenbachiella ulvae]|uniref:Cytochrome c n=1 Tax=Reichenbachiella ulvae TaxID=2980104 RepID=A0ABT3CN59_9BACT|nr:cytochrome c [Reichenbachiella ulvae]MCV9385158.1 cytochrome c [Reichenbachiella ulvae]
MKHFAIILALMVLFACSSDKKKQQQSPAEVAEAKTTMSPKIQKGLRVYKSNCLACHQADGSGIARVNPPLIGTKWVLGDKETLIGVVLNGLEGKIEVDSVKYNSVMNSFSYLSDEEVAALLTYVRQSWGNDASEIMAQDVAAVRSKED